MITARALSDDRFATLVDKHQGAHLLCRLPQGHEDRVIVGAPIDFVIDHRPHQAERVDRPVQLSDGRWHVLHGNLRKALKTLRMVHGHLMHFVVALPVHGGDSLGIPVVVVKSCPGGDDVDIHPERVHVGEALLWGPDRPGSNAHAARCDAVPRLPGLHGMDEALGGQMSMNIDTAHVSRLNVMCQYVVRSLRYPKTRQRRAAGEWSQV